MVASIGVGCDRGKVINISTDPYQGPPLSVQTRSGQHVVVLTAPTSGWQFTNDATRQVYQRTNVFVTLVRPNPAWIFTEAQVEQEAATAIDPARSIQVFARVLPYGTEPGTQSYKPALLVPGLTQEAAPPPGPLLVPQPAAPPPQPAAPVPQPAAPVPQPAASGAPTEPRPAGP
jgi:hypothetical protein